MPSCHMTPAISALRAWADAAIEHQDMTNAHGDCTLTLLAGELSPTDEEAREDPCNAFLRWQTLLHDRLHAIREQGDLRPRPTSTNCPWCCLRRCRAAVS